MACEGRSNSRLVADLQALGLAECMCEFCTNQERWAEQPALTQERMEEDAQMLEKLVY